MFPEVALNEHRSRSPGAARVATREQWRRWMQNAPAASREVLAGGGTFVEFGVAWLAPQGWVRRQVRRRTAVVPAMLARFRRRDAGLGLSTDRTVEFVVSTGAVDSFGEVLDQTTWRLDRYRANPVVLFAHNDRDLPIGRAEQVTLKDGNLSCRVRFATAEANPKAEQVFQMVKSGFLLGASAGFVPSSTQREIGPNGKPIYRLTGLELFEISIVPVPANPETLATVNAGTP